MKDNKSRCCGYAKPHGDIDKCYITMNDCNPSVTCILLLNEQNDILTDKLITIKKYINKVIIEG